MVIDGVVVVGLGGKGTSDGRTPYSPADLMSFRGGVMGLDDAIGMIRPTPAAQTAGAVLPLPLVSRALCAYAAQAVPLSIPGARPQAAA